MRSSMLPQAISKQMASDYRSASTKDDTERLGITQVELGINRVHRSDDAFDATHKGASALVPFHQHLAWQCNKLFDCSVSS